MTPLNNIANSIASHAIGQYGKGNIDLYARPQVKNSDGSVSTVRSMSFNDGSKEILVPTVSNSGTLYTPQQAIDNYRKTGEYLGKFDTPKQADTYAQRLHLQQQRLYPTRGSLLSL